MRSNCALTPSRQTDLSSYIPRLDCGLYSCCLLSALTNIPILPDFVLSCPFRKGLYLLYQLGDEARKEEVETIQFKLQYHKDKEQAEQVKQITGWQKIKDSLKQGVYAIYTASAKHFLKPKVLGPSFLLNHPNYMVLAPCINNIDKENINSLFFTTLIR